MTGIGTTLKQLRLLRGMTQATLYGGIISRSFAGRLERDQHTIGADKLFTILDRLNVSADEFRFIQNGYRPTTNRALFIRLLRIYNQQNFPQLRHFDQTYRNSPDPEQRRLAMVAQLLITIYDHLHWTITPEMTALWERLQRADYWTIQDLVYGMMWLLLATAKQRPDQIQAGITKMHASCDRYVSDQGDPLAVLRYRAEFDLLAFQILLQLPDKQLARKFRAAFTPPHATYLMLGSELLYQVCEAIWQWYFGDPAKGDAYLALINSLSDTYYLGTDLRGILKQYQQIAAAYRQNL